MSEARDSCCLFLIRLNAERTCNKMKVNCKTQLAKDTEIKYCCFCCHCYFSCYMYYLSQIWLVNTSFTVTIAVIIRSHLGREPKFRIPVVFTRFSRHFSLFFHTYNCNFFRSFLSQVKIKSFCFYLHQN